jgi:DNA replicative helicase MCM subunit Mcm2 (Cdc46/Mcm family)
VWKKLWELVGQRKHVMIWTKEYCRIQGYRNYFECKHCGHRMLIPTDFQHMVNEFKGCRPKRKENPEGWYELDGK